MPNNDLQKNKIIIIFTVIIHFIVSIFNSVILFFKHLFWRQTRALKENKFLDITNFVFNIWPKSFWQNPTGLKIWRSLATFIHYIFDKEEHFKEKK